MPAFRVNPQPCLQRFLFTDYSSPVFNKGFTTEQLLHHKYVPTKKVRNNGSLSVNKNLTKCIKLHRQVNSHQSHTKNTNLKIMSQN